MKQVKFLTILSLALAVGFVSCKNDDDETTPTTPTPSTGNVIVSSNITADATWTADKIYELAGRITVTSGATLTIQPGTIIKGQAGTGANATALLVARGGKLMAQGTADAPIIFTSAADNIQIGQTVSPNLDPSINGLWGGIIILGNANISASNDNGDVSEVQIEGIPTSDANGLYGGSDDADNSGVIQYISIRHGGTNIGAGNEINGLTLGGVGSGTTIDHIEVVANQDDGIEWFGGTVNVSDAITWRVGDDGMDTDQAWNGTCSNFIVIAPAGHIFELDGPEGTYINGNHTFENGSIIASDDDVTSEDLVNIDDNSNVNITNVYYTGIQSGQTVEDNASSPDVTYTGIELDVPADSLGNHWSGASGVSAGGSPKANKGEFGWTWASQAGALKQYLK